MPCSVLSVLLKELFSIFFSTNGHCKCGILQMAALELHDTDGPVLRENIYKAIDGLEQPHQKVQVQQMLSDYLWVDLE